MTRTVKNAFTAAVVFVLMLIALLVLVFRFGPRVELLVKPPLFADIAAVKITANDVATDLIVSGVKTRDCFLQSANAEVLRDGEWIRADVKMLKIDGSILSPQEQRIPVGSRFMRHAHIEPSGDKIRLSVDSTCHPFWVTHEELAELDTPH
jgi:hypothetical protein